MKAFELLKALNAVRDSYVVSAEEFRQGGHRRARLSINRVWLIAAVVALMLLLVGCTIVYVLRMQDMKVGEYSFYLPTYYDEEGNVIPVETQEPITQLSVQGVNMEALAEWLAFTNTYDQDGSIALAADKATKEGSADSPWNFPDNYHLTYGCYSQEMVEKLDEIVAKYDLKLLSEYIIFNWWESRALLDSLSIDGLLYDDSGAEYWDGDLHLEGTFGITVCLTLDMDGWSWERGCADYRYSLKDYFDPATDSMMESRDYTQWDYTRKDGKSVLLVLNEGTARIYADLPEAFISISLDPVIRVDGEEVPMTQAALEQLAELFDLDVKPLPTTMETVEKYKEEALARYEAEKAAAAAEHEAQYVAGYEEFVKYRLETMPSPSTASYILFDINGDGVEELIINCYDILSKKDGQSYRYFDLLECGVFLSRFQPCEGNIFEVWCENFSIWQHYFYQAGAESASFITGVIYDSTEDIWYRSLSGGSYEKDREQITKEEAQAILDSYTRIDFDWLPLKKFGETVLSVTYMDPYARYIANMMDRYDDAADYKYTLMDLNGDGVEELVTQETVSKGDGTTYPVLTVHSIKDGELWDLNIDINSFSYVCEGGILESTEEYIDDRGYHEYSRVTEDGVEKIESVFQERGILVWHRVEAGKDGRAVTEEEAMSVINSYKRVELDMKPFTEYPFR